MTADDSLKEQTPYTPSMDEVRSAFGDAHCLDPDDPLHAHGCPADARFDRWLAAHEQKVREEAWEEGYVLDDLPRCALPCGACAECMSPPTPNPYTPKETPDE